MEKCNFDMENFDGIEEEIFECPRCGNHVCRRCFKENFGVCPNCFGRLFRIS
jgi:acetyl-CoA carboxylase beta subunit